MRLVAVAVPLLVGFALSALFGWWAADRLIPEHRQRTTGGWDIPVQGRVINSSGFAFRNVGIVDVRFEYELDGRTYRTGRYALSPGYTNSRDAYEIPAALRPGARISGWANPENPAEAVMVRGRIGGLAARRALHRGYEWLAISVICAAGGVGVALSRWPNGADTRRRSAQGVHATGPAAGAGARPGAGPRLRPLTRRWTTPRHGRPSAPSENIAARPATLRPDQEIYADDPEQQKWPV